MDFFSVLSMIGGLALFLYGMHVMGDGLSKVSGGKMEKILESLTSNPVSYTHLDVYKRQLIIFVRWRHSMVKK